MSDRNFECVVGLIFAAAFVSAPFIAIHEYKNAPLRKFILESGEVVWCRHLDGNARYGQDLTHCEDGMNRYNIPGKIMEWRPK